VKAISLRRGTSVGLCDRRCSLAASVQENRLGLANEEGACKSGGNTFRFWRIHGAIMDCQADCAKVGSSDHQPGENSSLPPPP